jgi:hypothetical protein
VIYTVDKRKPPLPQAVRWDGSNIMEVANFAHAHRASSNFATFELHLVITHEADGEHTYTLRHGDWLVRSAADELRVLSQKEFFMEYEIVQNLDVPPAKAGIMESANRTNVNERR